MRATAVRQPARNFVTAKPAAPSSPARVLAFPGPQRRHESSHRQCACGGQCPRCQAARSPDATLQVSQPGDPAEQEADRIANQVMSAAARDSSGAPSTGVSRAPISIQRQALDAGSDVTGPPEGAPQGWANLPYCAREYAQCRWSCLADNAKRDCADCCSKAFDTCMDIGIWITREGGCSGND